MIYFPVYGRGESCRMILAHAKANWESENIGGEVFGARKAAGEFINGQLPVLMYNGKQYNESTSILRFLGKKFGYYSADADEAWFADATVDYINDQIGKTYPPIMKKEFTEENLATFIGIISAVSKHLNKQLVAHGKTFLCGDKMTTGDFHAAAYVMSFVYNKSSPMPEEWSSKAQAAVAENAAFAAWCDKVKAELAEYLETRIEASF